MLPLLHKEIVDKHGWATGKELLDYFAIGQATPGIIAVNTATFVGYKQRGVLGAMGATLGMVLPSLILISAVAAVLMRISDHPLFAGAFTGIRVVVIALILKSVMALGKQAISSPATLTLAVTGFVCSALVGVSPVFIIIGGMCAGFFLKQNPGKVSDR